VCTVLEITDLHDVHGQSTPALLGEGVRWAQYLEQAEEVLSNGTLVPVAILAQHLETQKMDGTE